MTKRLDRLEALRLTRRKPDPRDRRGRLVALTDDGRAVIDRAVEAHLQNEEGCSPNLPAPKREHLAALLRELLTRSTSARAAMATDWAGSTGDFR